MWDKYIYYGAGMQYCVQRDDWERVRITDCISEERKQHFDVYWRNQIRIYKDNKPDAEALGDGCLHVQTSVDGHSIVKIRRCSNAARGQKFKHDKQTGQLKMLHDDRFCVVVRQNVEGQNVLNVDVCKGEGFGHEHVYPFGINSNIAG
jgi:hypothetical protein